MVMKKILFIVLFLMCVAGGWYLFANKLDYNKIVFGRDFKLPLNSKNRLNKREKSSFIPLRELFS